VVRFSRVRTVKSKALWLKAHDEAMARWISNVLSPPIVATCFAIAFFSYIVPDPRMSWRWILLTLPAIMLPPLAYVIWLVHRGELGDIHMPVRETRLKPLSVMMVWLLFCILMLQKWDAPRSLDLLLLTVLVELSVLSLITLFWQISFHSATISAAAATAVAIGGTTVWPITITLLVPLVGWSRVRLRRHTLRQVTAGCLVGALLALLVLIGILPFALSAEAK
jgi:membrane-associated phospholipid phosphatase